MKYARILSIGLVATVAFAWSAAAAIENAGELAGYCQSLNRGAKGAGRHISIPRTSEALTCWGYMQAMQDLSVLADEEGHRIMGACPPEQTTTLQLIQSFVRYAHAHRIELQGNAVVAVFRALREAYPCRAGRTPLLFGLALHRRVLPAPALVIREKSQFCAQDDSLSLSLRS
jgi:Rap1a immunity proteins